MQRVCEKIFLSAVRQAMESAQAYTALHEIYASLGVEVDQRQPVCDASGKCCRFDSYGHRLYVTTLELGVFVRDLRQLTTGPSPSSPPRLQLPQLQSGDACVFQIDKLCGVHDIRPFGCRMFYCDPTATDWQNDAYERYHAELKRLHGLLGVPYLYVEWRWAVKTLKLERPGAADRLSPGGTGF